MLVRNMSKAMLIAVLIVFTLLIGCKSSQIRTNDSLSTPTNTRSAIIATKTVVSDNSGGDADNVVTPDDTPISTVRLEYAEQYCPIIPKYPNAEILSSETDETPGKIRRTTWYLVSDSKDVVLDWYDKNLQNLGWYSGTEEASDVKRVFGYEYPESVLEPPITTLHLILENNAADRITLKVEYKMTDVHTLSLWCPLTVP